MANINKIRISGTSYDIQDLNAPRTVELTQAEYDALVTAGTVSADTYYIITDATAVDISNYYTTAQTQSAINQATSGKANSSDVYLKTETSGATEISTALNGKQDTLVSSVNIKTINNESLLGSGNIDIQGGGGKAIEAGRGISITTGETADTVSFNLPISAGTGGYSIVLGAVEPIQASAPYTIAGGYGSRIHYTSAKKGGSIAFGAGAITEGFYSQAFGEETKTKNSSEFASGKYNTSSSGSSTFGDSGNTLFSVGNGTADNARHNAFEIRQNGDIYLSSGGTDIKLQDHLGGGGGGSEATVSALTCYKEAILTKQYTEGEIATFYVKYSGNGGFGTTYINFSIYNNGYEEYKMISADYNDGAFTSLTASDTAYTATIEDGDIKIVLASGCSLKINYGTNDCTAFIYTEYSSGTTSEVMVDTVYDAICRLSDKNLTNVLKQVNVNLSDGRLYLNGIGTIANANTAVDVASSTINTNDGKLNVHFSGTTSHGVALNTGGGNYCQLFSVYEYSKGYDDIEMTINSGYTGGNNTTTFTIAFINSSGNISSSYNFDYNITANTISTPSGYDTYGTIVNTLSTDYKVKFLPNSGYKIAAFMSNACLIGGVDTQMPNNYISNLVTTTSYDYNGQEVIDDIYSKLDTKQTTLTAGTGISIVDNVISATGGGGGMTEDDELLLSTALVDLNERKIDASEVKSQLGNYQKKGDYVTTSTLNTRLAEYETALDEQNVEEVTAYALNDLNDRFGGLKIVKITESEYAALTTKDENTLYIVVADPS